MAKASDRGDGQARGREARAPGEISARSWWVILKRTVGQFMEDRILLVAAGVTFYGLLALVPALVAFISLYGLFFDPNHIERQLALLAGVLPGGAVDIIRDQAMRIASQNGSTLSLTFFSGLAFSLWSANAGMKSMIDALNIAYEENEKRSFLMLNAQALLMTFGAIVFLISVLAAVAVLPVVLEYVGLGQIAKTLLSFGRWPILLVIVIFALAVLYRFAPNRERAEWRWITWGSAIAAMGWLIFSMLFSWYVGNFANYNETYGSLGAIIGFMTWMWLSTTIVLVGAELNAELEHRVERDTTTDRDRTLAQLPTRVADRAAKPRL